MPAGWGFVSFDKSRFVSQKNNSFDVSTKSGFKRQGYLSIRAEVVEVDMKRRGCKTITADCGLRQDLVRRLVTRFRVQLFAERRCRNILSGGWSERRLVVVVVDSPSLFRSLVLNSPRRRDYDYPVP